MPKARYLKQYFSNLIPNSSTQASLRNDKKLTNDVSFTEDIHFQFEESLDSNQLDDIMQDKYLLDEFQYTKDSKIEPEKFTRGRKKKNQSIKEQSIEDNQRRGPVKVGLGKVAKNDGKQQKCDRQLKKKLARIMCETQNFKYDIVRDILHSSRSSFTLNKPKFKLLYEQIGKSLIQQIQNHLQSSQFDYKPLDPSQKQALLRTITNCKRYLVEHDCSIIINVTKKVFQLGSCNLDEQQYLNIHRRLRQVSDILIKAKEIRRQQPRKRAVERSVSSQENSSLLKKKKKCDKNKPSVKAVWNKDHQRLLRESYKEYRSLEKVRSEFILRCPQYKHLWTVASLQQRLNRIIRESLHLLSAFVFSKRTNNLPILTPLNPATVKAINKSPSATDIRLLLIDVLQNNHVISSMRELIVKINAFCSCLSQQKIEEDSDGSVASLRQSDSVKSVNYAEKSDINVMLSFKK